MATRYHSPQTCIPRGRGTYADCFFICVAGLAAYATYYGWHHRMARRTQRKANSNLAFSCCRSRGFRQARRLSAPSPHLHPQNSAFVREKMSLNSRRSSKSWSLSYAPAARSSLQRCQCPSRTARPTMGFALASRRTALAGRYRRIPLICGYTAGQRLVVASRKVVVLHIASGGDHPGLTCRWRVLGSRGELIMPSS